jgi:aquaporin Z
MSLQQFRITALCPSASLLDAVRTHWREYLMEAAEMAMLMLCICAAGSLLYGRYSAVANLGLSWLAKSALMGVIVAGATLFIIRSPFGRRSGAHFNPALTLAYFSLGRIHRWDAFSYVMAHFLGGVAGVFFAYQVFGANLSDFPVRFVVTLPGRNGSVIAFLAEFVTSFALMEVVLLATNHRRLARYTPFFVALVTVFYYMLSMSLSGYSVNPARSFSSALFAHIWRGIWIFFIAPGLGMLAAATLYRNVAGTDRIYCAKLLHDFQSNCPFNCRIAVLYGRPQPVNDWCPETAPASAPQSARENGYREGPEA